MPNQFMNAAMVMICAALLIAFVRFLRGPSLPDRVVAIDLIGVSAVALMALGAAANAERTFLDVAMVIALVAFLGTVAYARYAQKESRE